MDLPQQPCFPPKLFVKENLCLGHCSFTTRNGTVAVFKSRATVLTYLLVGDLALLLNAIAIASLARSSLLFRLSSENARELKQCRQSPKHRGGVKRGPKQHTIPQTMIRAREVRMKDVGKVQLDTNKKQQRLRPAGACRSQPRPTFLRTIPILTPQMGSPDRAQVG